MFPTIADLFAYFFNVHFPIPIQTFGFFVALAFLLSCFVFIAEFKRKEADGLIRAFIETEEVGAPPSFLELLVNALLGFVFGFKAIGAIINYKTFIDNPVRFIFSANGNLWMGLLSAIAFAVWVYWDRREQELPTPKFVEKEVHPYQLVPYLVFALGFFGFIGAKLFSAVENFQLLVQHPVDTLFSANGFNYYGGLVFGSVTYLYICHKKGMKLVHLADIGSPGMIVAYGVGRIGCQLAGDGDWGIVNKHPKPIWLQWLPDWMWSFKFPHNAIDAGARIDGCFGIHCEQLRTGVYPTSFYEVVMCLVIFVFMWMIRKHIHVPGLMFYLFLITSGVERILIETIRINKRYSFLGLDLTQAEIISAGMVIGGLVGISTIIYRQIKHKERLHF